MIPSAFEGLLSVERVRRRAAKDGGFALPFLQEIPVGPEDGPFLVSNMRGSFVQPGVSKENTLRYSFSPCLVEFEPAFLSEFFRVLWGVSEQSGWPNRCSSVAQARQRFNDFGLHPRTLLMPLENLQQICGQEITLDDARKLTVAQGCVTEVEGVRVMFSELPRDKMIMGAAPPIVGVYTRVDDYLGLVFRQVNRSVILIHNELAR